MLNKFSATTGFRATVLPLLIAVWSLAGCGEDDGPHRYTRFAMGTVVEYVVVDVEPDVARAAVEKAHAELERVASLLWEGDSLSEISRVNSACESRVESPESRAPGLARRSRGPGSACDYASVSVSGEVARFLSRALTYSLETGGAFDVTVGSFLGFYDFTAEHPSTPDTVEIRRLAKILGVRSRDLAIDSAGVSGSSHIYDRFGLTGLHSGVRIAVGGVAKGYAVDRAVEVLREAGIRGALVNAGGDLYCLGTNKGEPWRVGIRDPDDAGSVVAAVEVIDAAVATSGDYQQYFEVDGVRYHHLLDPDTGLPARLARSATVIASSAERADALATGLFVEGEAGLAFIEGAPETESLLVNAEGNQLETTGMGKYLISE